MSLISKPARVLANHSFYLCKNFGLIAQQDFAAANELLVDPQAIFIRAGFGAGAWWTGLQAHANRSLKNMIRVIVVSPFAYLARASEQL
jgi:hypothetical protein